MNDCIFCKIVNGDVPSKKVFENSDVMAFETIQPVAEHHILIIPKKHISIFLELKEDDKSIFIEMAKVAQEVIKIRKIENGYKLIFNGGKYQMVKHLHWHLLGGKLEDEDDILNKT